MPPLLGLWMALAGMAPAAAALSGTVAWDFKMVDWRGLYMPSAADPGAFDAIEVHQGIAITPEAGPSLRDIFGATGQTRIETDDEVAGKDYPGRDRIRIVTDVGGEARLEVDMVMERRDGSEMPTARARYTVPLVRFGNGWAAPIADSGPHFDAATRLQTGAIRGHLNAMGWRIKGLKSSHTLPPGEHALRLMPEAGGWRLISVVPYTIRVAARLSK